MYQLDDYDAAGAAIGAVQKELILPFKNEMQVGDVLIGLASNGVHSNGFSLVRRIVGREGLAYTDPAPWDASTSVGLSLLTPTRIYVRSLLQVVRKRLVKGLSHITGGGLSENVPRMLPKHLAAEIDVAAWKLPPVFQWLQKAGNVEPKEMSRAFNTGVGMVAVASKENVDELVRELEAAGETVYRIGSLIERTEEGCVLKNLESWASS
jgi:phosphoribosylamine--glycine ligase/phosphoribosylformylglycinamidine cyclo-ligase